jgi:hypothetical protein
MYLQNVRLSLNYKQLQPRRHSPLWEPQIWQKLLLEYSVSLRRFVTVNRRILLIKISYFGLHGNTDMVSLPTRRDRATVVLKDIITLIQISIKYNMDCHGAWNNTVLFLMHIKNFPPTINAISKPVLFADDTESTWYVGHCWPIVPAPDYRWWLWSSWWNEDWQGKPKYSEKTCPSAMLMILV